jgi:hypothetical protein
MKRREHDFYRGFALALDDAYGDAPAVVGDATPPVRQKLDGDLVAIARHRLVHGVVYDLVNEVMEPARAGRSDVHTRSLAHGLEALQHRDVFGCVALLRRACGRGRGLRRGHILPSSSRFGVAPSPTFPALRGGSVTDPGGRADTAIGASDSLRNHSIYLGLSSSWGPRRGPSRNLRHQARRARSKAVSGSGRGSRCEVVPVPTCAAGWGCGRVTRPGPVHTFTSRTLAEPSKPFALLLISSAR